MGDAFLLMRVEQLSGRIDLFQAVARERALQLLEHQRDAIREAFPVRLLPRRAEAEAEIVEHGNEILHQAGDGELPELILVAHGALAEILEVRHRAQVALVVGRRLFLGRSQLLVEHGLGGGRTGGRGHIGGFIGLSLVGLAHGEACKVA